MLAACRAQFTHDLVDGFASPQQRGDQEQLRRCVAPSCRAQRRVSYGFKQTPSPFQKRYLALARVELKSPAFGFLPRCDTRWLFQILAPN